MRLCEHHRLSGCAVPEQTCIGCALEEVAGERDAMRAVVEAARALYERNNEAYVAPQALAKFDAAFARFDAGK